MINRDFFFYLASLDVVWRRRRMQPSDSTRSSRPPTCAPAAAGEQLPRQAPHLLGGSPKPRPQIFLPQHRAPTSVCLHGAMRPSVKRIKNGISRRPVKGSGCWRSTRSSGGAGVGDWTVLLSDAHFVGLCASRQRLQFKEAEAEGFAAESHHQESR